MCFNIQQAMCHLSYCGNTGPGRGLLKAAAIVDCLTKIVVAGEDSSFLAYTTERTKATNRDGLFEVGDGAYLLFKTMETLVKACLKHMFPVGLCWRQR